jgi:hypothetical protein
LPNKKAPFIKGGAGFSLTGVCIIRFSYKKVSGFARTFLVIPTGKK